VTKIASRKVETATEE